MFQSATLKLTAWYLAILMSISLIFSITIYQMNFHELNVRLENLQRGLTGNEFIPIQQLPFGGDQYRLAEARQASQQMILSLFYVNLLILIGGGVGSFLLARRTIRPIEKAHESMSRFTSDASHELRTPLAAMKTELEVSLRDPKLTKEEMRELLESSLEEANKLIKLSEVFLKLARLDFDSLEQTQVDMVALLNSVMKKYSDHASRFTITTRKKALVTGNETALEELLTILIENALKYSPEGTPITVKIFEKRMSVVIQCSNQGEAISEEQQTHLFERFYRGDQSRTASSQNGYGLGLAIAKRITDVHRGDIRVESNAEETTFSVYLPNLRNIQAKLQNSSL